jgi:hypothetical protein
MRLPVLGWEGRPGEFGRMATYLQPLGSRQIFKLTGHFLQVGNGIDCSITYLELACFFSALRASLA